MKENNIKRFTNDWLFVTHDVQELMHWVSSLKYFYFMRAWGGHANDGDRFTASFKYTDKEDLQNKLASIKVDLFTIPDNYPRRIVGHPYTSEEFSKFKNEIKDFPNIEQPGHRVVNEQKCFIWVERGIIDISIFNTRGNDCYNVYEEDFEACRKVELLFASLNWMSYKNEEIENSIQCICSKNYPEWF